MRNKILKLNKSHPAYPAMVCGLYTNIPGKVIDLKHGNQFSFVDTTQIDWVIDNTGLTLSGNRDGAVYLDITDRIDVANDGLTILAGCKFKSFDGSAFGGAFSIASLATTDYLYLGHTTAAAFKIGSLSKSPGSGTTLSANQDYVIGMTIDPNTGANGTGNAYLDGVYDYSSTFSGSIDFANFGRLAFYNIWQQGSTNWGTLVTDANIKWITVFRGMLTAPMIHRISTNPKELLFTPQVAPHAVAAAGGNSNLLTLGVG